jgi:hypothetical protein
MCERQKPARPEWRDEGHRPWIIFFKKRLGLFTDPSPSKDATQAKKKQQRSMRTSSYGEDIVVFNDDPTFLLASAVLVCDYIYIVKCQPLSWPLRTHS